MKLLSPRALLHAEGLAVLAAACIAYRHLGGSWTQFAVLFLAPDLLMLGYLFGAGTGAWVYNTGHTYVAPLLLGALAYGVVMPSLYPLCAIWAAHIGFDRLLGYGLKYGTAFRDTHLARV